MPKKNREKAVHTERIMGPAISFVGFKPIRDCFNPTFR